MLLTLFWLSLAVCCTPSLSAKAELPALLQTPAAIVLSKLNSTAELRCSTTLKPLGLYLKQRYSKPRELLYLSISDNTKTITSGFEHRLSVTGECCDFTLRLSELQIEDTDGYYCQWAFSEGEGIKFSYRQDKETVIIVRDGDPEEECNKQRMVHHLLFIISVLTIVTMFIICTGLIIWKFWQSSQHYSPHKVPHRYHQPQCLHHRRQQPQH
ncbi:uncharacterized protein LOC108429374 [Pygocentrus nattereri]|uniref:uncharacterized protein LOC108429374 n=1 Tax=Pygocentrus nattereri TaxID=42514 RepID=UPI000814865F|nr:uncharacterized protein LOC108429374 [Pygocentrus nattereri]